MKRILLTAKPVVWLCSLALKRIAFKQFDSRKSPSLVPLWTISGSSERDRGYISFYASAPIPLPSSVITVDSEAMMHENDQKCKVYEAEVRNEWAWILNSDGIAVLTKI